MNTHLPVPKRAASLFYYLFLSVLVCIGTLTAEEVCKFTYMGLPERIHNDTLDLPGDAVAMGSHVRVGNSSFLVMEGKPSSVMMIIDNSSSNWDTDPNCDRYKVMTAFLDSVYAKSPRTSVGLAVFGTTLWFDPADDALFQPLNNGSKGGYIPLLVLDSTYTGTNSNVGYPKKGIEILKFYLQYKSIPPELLYSSFNFMGRGTNINIGFEAAKDAMLASPSPKDRHFCIFLSDGEATEPANGDMFLYVNGTGVPTTFTVYYTPDDSIQAFENLVKMTNNIKNNGYSSSNPLSNLWSIKTDYNTLMKLLMENVIKLIITSQTTFVPTDLSVNTIVSVSGWDSTGFEYGKLFPLIGKETVFKYNINYKMTKDSIVGTDTITVVIKDTATEVSFTANIDPALPVSDSVELSHWGRNLEFYYNNTPINQVSETMNTLEIRFTEYKVDTLYDYENVSIILTHSGGTVQDMETFLLDDMGSYLSFEFPRTVADPVPGDGILQHQDPDNIIAIFRNADLPLDTLRISIPLEFNDPIDIECAYYYDNNGDGYVDSIYVEATTEIAGGLTDDHVGELLDNAITLPAFRNFTINSSAVTSGGFYIDVTEDKSNNPTTYVTPDDKFIVSKYILSIGGKVEAGNAPIYDKVAPIIHWAPKSALLTDYPVDTTADTLRVTFSEPVRRVTPDEPFYFLDQDHNTNYTVKLSDAGQPENDKMVFYVTSLSGVDYMEEGDSLWIKETDRVGDNEGNYQNNDNNTRRKLYVERKAIPYDFNPVAISPIDLANIHINKIPSEIIAVMESQGILDNLNLSQNGNGSYVGMLIMALPDPENIGKFMPDIEVEGHISIFDPVGNQVVSRSRMAWWHETKRLLYVWNVKNNNGRTVGLGSYLAVIEIEDITPSLTDQNVKKKSAKKILLGVGSRITH